MSPRTLIVWILVAAGVTSYVSSQSTSSPSNGATPGAPSVAPGSEACAGCHSEIFHSYKKTAMAGASGPAGEGLITGEFVDKKSGVTYRVFEREGRVWMSYERDGEAARGAGTVVLHRVRDEGADLFVFGGGILFETPINWYSQEGRWNMTPAYTEAREIPMNLPSFVELPELPYQRAAAARARGRRTSFRAQPFLHAGITCERCHGAGEGHMEGKGTIVNPAKLPPERRDAICMECHFEGTVAVEQPGKHLYQFQPGEKLVGLRSLFLAAREIEPQTAGGAEPV